MVKHILDISRMHIFTYISLSNFTLNFRISIATRFSEEMLLLWKFVFAIIASTPYLSFQRITSCTLTHITHIVLSKIALFINLNMFFSNSFFAKVLKFILNSIYSWSHGNCELQYTMDLYNAETSSLQIAIYDITLFTIQCTTSEELLLSLAEWFHAFGTNDRSECATSKT